MQILSSRADYSQSLMEQRISALELDISLVYLTAEALNREVLTRYMHSAPFLIHYWSLQNDFMGSQ